jgi:hypothetical protein
MVKVLHRVARGVWRFIMQVIELASAILTIIGIYLLLRQVDWFQFAYYVHLR